MTVEITKQQIVLNDRISFVYNNEPRTITVTNIGANKQGEQFITGKTDNNEYKSFSIGRIYGRIARLV